MLLLSHGVIGGDLLVGAQIGGIHLGEEPVSVIGELVGISHDLLHGHATGSDLLQGLMLLNQSIFQRRGVLIKNRRSFQTEVINDGGAYLA